MGDNAVKKRKRTDARIWRCVWGCCTCVSAVIDCCSNALAGDGGISAPRHGSAKDRVMLWLGLASLVLGLILAVSWSHLLNIIVNRELSVTPGSKSYSVWRETPVPLRLDFYFWNWTNPRDLGRSGTVPHFEQRGPYSFTETKEKVNISWNDNGTISFRQLRFWYFDEDNSNGSLSDAITTINPVALTAAHVVRDWHVFLQRSVSIALQSTAQTLDVTHSVGQFLFEGYSDPLITIASKVPGLASVNIPFDRFGWFYKRNGSAEYDGLLNMQTGAEDIERLGELSMWNYKNLTPFYGGECSRLHGSAGELWPPGPRQAQGISLFSPDLCRSVSLQYSGSVREAGISGLKFSGGPLMLDNGQLDPANQCFCDGECVPGGVANVSSCRYGAPAFVSFPHFHLADPAYRRNVSGMQPDPDKHSFYITLEPTYGIPLDVAARFQINLLVRRNEMITMLRRAPEQLMFPVLWFEQRAGITPELAAPLRLLLHLPLAGILAAGALVLGAISCLAAPYCNCPRRHRPLPPRDLRIIYEEVELPAANGKLADPPSSNSEDIAKEKNKDGLAEEPLLRGSGNDTDQAVLPSSNEEPIKCAEATLKGNS